MKVEQNVRRILSELPAGVQLLAAAKTRQPQEILAAVTAGVEIIGENYVQEAERAYEVVGNRVKWHFIGHLQKNKVKKAVRLFDMIETVDSLEIAREIDKRCAQIGKIMPVLIEVNSAREKQKSGVFPEEVAPLVREMAALPNLRVEGLMTMGPDSANPEDLRLVFAETRKTFDRISQLNLPGVEMRYLSMGMTDSYKIALEEGSNIVRLGSKIFGERDYEED
ncbi:MAG: YggS family pyridoxal phosphate-dependent enzyme [Chloroflexi bacterium]|nr:YggS family pyridoxal phosphate-dependent enzyme [Chloroflexota bacterium]MBI3930850.1 YggS family pyridoxal phosphate-dependent enzyme [Chloroflexota bacterium]